MQYVTIVNGVRIPLNHITLLCAPEFDLYELGLNKDFGAKRHTNYFPLLLTQSLFVPLNSIVLRMDGAIPVTHVRT